MRYRSQKASAICGAIAARTFRNRHSSRASPLKRPRRATFTGARVLVSVGDSVTTDHISPAGPIALDSPAGDICLRLGVPREDFNAYGARRGNHEVMMRGTFANIRIRNRLVPGVEGGYTQYLPTGEKIPMYDAAMKYVADGTPLIVLAGKEYGTGFQPRLGGQRPIPPGSQGGDR